MLVEVYPQREVAPIVSSPPGSILVACSDLSLFDKEATVAYMYRTTTQPRPPSHTERVGFHFTSATMPPPSLSAAKWASTVSIHRTTHNTQNIYFTNEEDGSAIFQQNNVSGYGTDDMEWEKKRSFNPSNVRLQHVSNE